MSRMQIPENRNKIAALDLGNVWIGVALSDSLKFFARPYTTVKKNELETFLRTLLTQEPIQTIVVGLPKTMSGGLSEQTRIVIAEKERLEKKFLAIHWILWDERLSSKRALELKKMKKIHSHQTDHALAAAFILDSYLIFHNSTEHSY